MTLLSSIEPVLETPFDTYIAKQTELTAVERFSHIHAEDRLPQQARFYRDLIPFTTPAPGQQYAFSVDLDSCTGCKACVAACHTMNGLDEDELWRSVTLLRSKPTVAPFQQHVTSSCHHCVDPACLKGCPVNAYEKDPITGIVAHLDDQCIGCSYCTLACPYDVPVFNESRGIVRKCDMCRGRLEANEAPACVQGCPNEAIAITIVDIASVSADARANKTGPHVARVVAGAPPSTISIPATQYLTRRSDLSESTNAAKAQQNYITSEQPAQAHTPLAVMLVFTQLAVGTFVASQLLPIWSSSSVTGLSRTFDAGLSVAVGIVAMAASIFHLGRPRYFYRSVIGLRHSWLSREVVALGAFTTTATAYGVLSEFGSVTSRIADLVGVSAGTIINIAGVSAAVFGIVGVLCSVQIYAITRRTSWRFSRTAPKFFATAAILGLGTLVWMSVIGHSVASSDTLAAAGRSTGGLSAIVAALIVAKVATESSTVRFRRSDDPDHAQQARVGRLLTRQLRPLSIRRLIAAAVAFAAFAVLIGGLGDDGGLLALAMATVAIVSATAGELFERSLFFRTVGKPE
jgi:formate dehydrogenase iron-sulfur subunit